MRREGGKTEGVRRKDDFLQTDSPTQREGNSVITLPLDLTQREGNLVNDLPIANSKRGECRC